MAERKPIISFRNFSFQYRAQKRPTLTDIDLEIYPGERVLIAGPSGSELISPKESLECTGAVCPGDFHMC